MNPSQLKQDWDSRGYSFGIFKDPPGQVWADFVHKTDDLVVLAEGEIGIEIEVLACFSEILKSPILKPSFL